MSDQNKIIFIITAVGLLIMLLAGFIIVILYQNQKKQFAFLNSMKETSADHQRTILRTQLDMQEQTFQEISREIHDNICLNLGISKLHLSKLDISESNDMYGNINLSIHLIGKAIDDLGHISKSLNSDFIEAYGLMYVVENQINDLKSTGLFHVSMIVIGNPVPLGYNNELIVFRIIQESLNNIIKHSRASIITLEFNFAISFLRISVQDNGIGFDLREPANLLRGSGLKNIRKRAGMLSTSVHISSEPGKGTIVSLEVPYL